MAQVLLVVFGPVATDPRVLRQIDALSDEFSVTVAGYGPFEDSRVTFEPLGQAGPIRNLSWKAGKLWQTLELGLCSLRLYTLSYWLLHPAHFRFKRLLRSKTFDLILVNDSEGVAVATRHSPSTTVVIHDQHEYWPDLFINPVKRWAVQGYREWFVKKYLAPIPHWITVAEGIGQLYQKHFGLTQPVIITNAPGLEKCEPSRVARQRIDLVYHGVWDPGRGIEIMIEALSRANDRFHLNLIIVGQGHEHLHGVAKKWGVSARVHFVDPVQPRDIASLINQFDLGLVLNIPVNQSEHYALPNKVFESIQGRLGLIVGPSPEIAKVVSDGQCGVVLTDFGADTLAETLGSLSDDKIRHFKEKSHVLASQLSAEKNGGILRAMVRELLQSRKSNISGK